MYVPSVECTSVVHVVMLSLNSAGEGADSKFVPAVACEVERVRVALVRRES